MSRLFRFLLPSEGGGALRRLMTVRDRLYRDQWNDSRVLRGPVPLFDFRRRDDGADVRESLRPEGQAWGPFGGWRVSDDGVIGGYSTSRMEFVEGVLSDEDKDENPSSPSTSSPSSSSPPFLRWSGTLSTEINRQSPLARNVTRSGFAAILSPEFPFAAPLKNKYKALEICCRTDGRTYAVNVRVETAFPGDMYQGFIGGGTGTEEGEEEGVRTDDPAGENDSDSDLDSESPSTRPSVDQPSQSLDVRKYLKEQQAIVREVDPNNHPYHGHPPPGFQRFILPFRNLALTSQGRMRSQQRRLDGHVSLESIGFTLMDGTDGDFQFDLVSIRAVNVMGGEVVGTPEEDEAEEELSDRLRSGGKEEGGEKVQ